MDTGRILRKIAIYSFFIVLALSICYFIRMIPALGNEVEFTFGKAFNYRMTFKVLQNGDVPAIDRLSTYPAGRNIKAFLPTGMYHASAAFYRFINLFKPITLTRSILFFSSFCGSLIFIPIYLISYEVYRKKGVAYITGLLAGIIPAYLNRTLCNNYRHEILGVPLLFISLLFFIKAFGGSNIKKGLIYSAISATFMILAFCVWRLSLLFLFVYIIAFLYIWLKKTVAFKKSWLIFLTAVGAPYLFILLAPIITGQSYNYGSFPWATFQIIMQRIGIDQTFSDFTRLVYNTNELSGINLLSIFSIPVLSSAGIFIIIFLFSYFKNRGDQLQKDIIFIFLLFFFAITLIYSRNKVILGPLAAITLGEGALLALGSKKVLRRLLLSLIIIALIITLSDSLILASLGRRQTKIRPTLKDMLGYINKEIPKDSVVLCDWTEAYPIQTYCHLPTITDSLYESPETVRRIMAISRIYYSKDEDELLGFCKEYGVTHILIGLDSKALYAAYAGPYSMGYEPEGEGVTSLAVSTNIHKLLSAPQELNRLRLLHKNEELALYSIK